MIVPDFFILASRPNRIIRRYIKGAFKSDYFKIPLAGELLKLCFAIKRRLRDYSYQQMPRHFLIRVAFVDQILKKPADHPALAPVLMSVKTASRLLHHCKARLKSRMVSWFFQYLVHKRYTN